MQISVRESAGIAREGEPVFAGVCLPRGAFGDETAWRLVDEQDQELPVQVNPLRSWDKGGLQWVQVAWLADIAANESATYRLRSGPGSQHGAQLRVENSQAGVVVSVPGRLLTVDKSAGLFRTSKPEAPDSLEEVTLSARLAGREERAVIEEVDLLENGPVFCRLQLKGHLGKWSALRFRARLTFFPTPELVQLDVTLENPRRAQHRGGYWDLGDPGSLLLESVELNLETKRPADRVELAETASGTKRTGSRVTIHQESSGGENWQSRAHVDRSGQNNLRFRGYKLEVDKSEQEGLRASPCLSLVGEASTTQCSLTDFWHKFPSSLEADSGRIRIGLLPPAAQEHELQAGEHCTRRVWLQFGEEGRELAWTHDPLVPHVSSSLGAAHHWLPFLPTAGCEVRSEAREVLSASLEGASSLFAKRESIDEYGWRNFGDTWADHEEAHCDGPRPVISHYNNQYDLLHGVLVQYLLTADTRWWKLAEPLAQHLIDIDIYHTERDKSAYCGGLFWHTAHYHDAATSTHRSMSTQMRGKAIPAAGGGPANEHLYSAGLLLFYFLTGDLRAKEAVVGLAEWVVAMDDGQQHLLGLVSDIPTGSASCTADPSYHGPGRGAGNAVNTLVDGWLATQREHYLAHAEELIYRTVHPDDDIDARNLLDAEMRWSYTVYLQALARFLFYTRDVESLRDCREYAQAALLRYAHWMADNERNYLDHPEELEFPTETWAAQDLRKGNVLLTAAGLEVDGARADKLRQRGTELIDRAWAALMTHETRHHTRPVALVLQQTYIETYLRGHRERTFDFAADSSNHTFPASPPFTPQRVVVKAGLRSPLRLASMVGRAVQPQRWGNIVKRSWASQLLLNALRR